MPATESPSSASDINPPDTFRYLRDQEHPVTGAAAEGLTQLSPTALEEASQDKKALHLLTAAKLVMGGGVVGFFGSRLFGVSMPKFAAMEMGMGFLESMLVEGVYKGKIPGTQKLVDWAKKKSPKDISQNSNPVSPDVAAKAEEKAKERAVTRLSVIVTAVSGITSGLLAKYLLPRLGHASAHPHVAPPLSEALIQLRETRGITNRLTPALRVTASWLNEQAPVRLIKKNVWLGLAANTAMFMGVGWLEGKLAEAFDSKRKFPFRLFS